VARIDMPGGPLAELARGPSAYRWLRTAGTGFARVFSLVALAVAWELAARSGAFTPFMLPALSAVLERIWSDLVAGDLVLNTGVTLYRAFTGFLIGAVAGIALGMGISRNRFTHWFFDPIISVGFPMPKIAFLPVVMLWLGVYDMSKITMIAVEAVFPVASSASYCGRRATWAQRSASCCGRSPCRRRCLRSSPDCKWLFPSRSSSRS
jgi:ABC-type nitrate/sulfonate/bicarbonate transport system permease component